MKVLSYHGSDVSNIKKFDTSLDHRKNGNLFFSNSKMVASTYGNYVYECEIDTSNFLVIDGKKKFFKNIPTDDLPPEFAQHGKSLTTDQIGYIAQHLGYNGVEIKNVIDIGGHYRKGTRLIPTTDYIVFSPDTVTIKNIELSERYYKQMEKEKLITEGTSNFWSMEKFPLYIFNDYDSVYDSVYDETKEELGNDVDTNSEQFESAMQKNMEKYESEVCPALDEYDIRDMKSKIEDFCFEMNRDDRFDSYEDTEVEIEVKPGYYEAAQIFVKDEKYLKDWQVEKIKEFLKKLAEEYGLAQYGVSYSFSNGETGYHKVSEDVKTIHENLGDYAKVLKELSGKEITEENVEEFAQKLGYKADKLYDILDDLVSDMWISGNNETLVYNIPADAYQQFKRQNSYIESCKNEAFKHAGYGKHDDFASKIDREKEFFDWVKSEDSRLQSAHDWYKGYSEDALQELVSEYLDSVYTPFDFYKTTEDDGVFGIREKGTNDLLISSDSYDDIENWIHDNKTWSDDDLKAWTEAAKSAINEIGYYQWSLDDDM